MAMLGNYLIFGHLDPLGWYGPLVWNPHIFMIYNLRISAYNLNLSSRRTWTLGPFWTSPMGAPNIWDSQSGRGCS